MNIRKADTIRIVKELESNSELNLSVAEIIAVIEFLEKQKAVEAHKSETRIDGIRVVF